MAAKPLLPAPHTFVYQEKSILSPSDEDRVNESLTAFEKETHNQMVVAFFKTLEGEDLDDYSNRLFRHWGIGNKEKNNGLLLVIAIEDRKFRLEVGYGLEGEIPDVKAKQIAQSALVPAFKRGDYATGVIDLISSVKVELGGGGVTGVALESYKRLRRNPFDGFQLIAALGLILFLFLTKDIVLPIIGSFFLLNPFTMILLVPILLIFYALIIGSGHSVGPRGPMGRRRSRWPWYYYGSGWGGGGSSGSSGWGGGFGGGGGGGFSGGGGSSGGGGFSGNW